MKKILCARDYSLLILMLIFVFAEHSSAHAADRIAVIPLLGGAVGNAQVSDVVKGRTFSSKAAGKGAVGTLVLPPCVQTFTNSIGMTFNLLPAGGFTMGSPDDEPGGPYSDETQHTVLLHSFYMQTTEVTQKQWQDIIGNNPASHNIGGEYPIESVNWFEATYFANVLSQNEGRSICYELTGCSPIPGNGMRCTGVTILSTCTGYRLPTEAQWEYAARATTTTPWAYAYHYDTSADPGQVVTGGFNSNLDAMGWYQFNNATSYVPGTKPVAKKQANKWGLFDMHGNVWEWCQDWYGDYPSGGNIVRDPQGPETGVSRVARGGHWNATAKYARSAVRDERSPPGIASATRGFRLVLPASQ